MRVDGLGTEDGGESLGIAKLQAAQSTEVLSWPLLGIGSPGSTQFTGT